jgi:protein TonB
MAELPRVAVNGSLSGNSLAPMKPDIRGRAVTAAQPVNTANAVRSENLLPAAKATGLPGVAGSPKNETGAAQAHVLIDNPPTTPPAAPTAIAASLGHIDPCQLVHSVQPIYPRAAKKQHVEGNVELRVVVGVDGKVQSVGLVSGEPLLVPAAIDAARGFRYNPALLDGKPIETVQTINMSFELKD